MSDKGFIKFNRFSAGFEALIKVRPTAFVLLALIARRARRTKEITFDGIGIGEALIGDFEIYGVTEQVYRNDKAYLKRFNFATFKGTPKGTIAKLLNTSVFDINSEESQRTYQQADNDLSTNNKNVKNEKEAVAEILSIKEEKAVIKNSSLFVNGKEILNPVAYLEAIKKNEQPNKTSSLLKPVGQLTNNEILELLKGKVAGRDEGIDQDVLYEALERGLYQS